MPLPQFCNQTYRAQKINEYRGYGVDITELLKAPNNSLGTL